MDISYLLIVEAGEYNNYEETLEFNTMEDVLDYVENEFSMGRVLMAYEVGRIIDKASLKEQLHRRKNNLAEQRRMALSKLTPEEQRILGLA